MGFTASSSPTTKRPAPPHPFLPLFRGSEFGRLGLCFECRVFRIACFAFRVSCFVTHVSCFVFRVSRFVFRDSCLVFRMTIVVSRVGLQGDRRFATRQRCGPTPAPTRYTSIIQPGSWYTNKTLQCKISVNYNQQFGNEDGSYWVSGLSHPPALRDAHPFAGLGVRA